MRSLAFLSLAFGAFLLAFACYEYRIGDLECAASTTVLSGFFLGSGLLLFLVGRRKKAYLAELSGHGFDCVRRRSAYIERSRESELTDVDRSVASTGDIDDVRDIATTGKRPDVKKLIEELHSRTPQRRG